MGQFDAIRNSISAVAQTYFSNRELLRVTTRDMVRMLADRGVQWDDFPLVLRYETVVSKECC